MLIQPINNNCQYKQPSFKKIVLLKSQDWSVNTLEAFVKNQEFRKFADDLANQGCDLCAVFFKPNGLRKKYAFTLTSERQDSKQTIPYTFTIESKWLSDLNNEISNFNYQKFKKQYEDSHSKLFEPAKRKQLLQEIEAYNSSLEINSIEKKSFWQKLKDLF